MSLKIGVISGPPATACALDPICPIRGYGVDTAKFVCESLNLNCTFSWYQSNDWGDAYENGTGTGMVGAIQRGEFDTAIPVFTPTQTRVKAVSFSNVYFYPEIVLATRTPEVNRNMDWSIISAFQWPVWLMFIITLILIACFISKAHGKRRNFKGTTTLTELSTALIMNEFKESFMRFDSVRLLVSAWALVSLILTSAYTGKVFSDQVTQMPKLPFKDLQTFVVCLERMECTIVTPSLSLNYLKYFAEPDPRMIDKFKAIFERNPIKVIPSGIPEVMLAETNHYPVVILPRLAFLSWTSSNKDCKYYLVDIPFLDYLTFPVSKKSQHLKMLNRLAWAVQENGLLQLLKTKYVDRSNKCNELWSGKVDRKTQILLHSMSMTFSFYAMGIFVAISAFGLEIWYKRIVTRMRQFVWCGRG